MPENKDRIYMMRALRLARRGAGRVSPNPMVGAVLVRRGRVVGEGWHRRFGGAHAEIEALNVAGRAAQGATLYVTLEPCAHTGKTPPCTEAVAAAGVRRVVAAIRDPNPKVRGGGCRVLARKGVDVETGLLEAEARELDRPYFTWAETGRPMVTLKLASSLDGRIALAGGDSRWITGEPARIEAHRLRARNDAVLVGRRTVSEDDPSLTVRHVRGRNPVRIVLDPRLSTSTRAKWLIDDGTRRIAVAGSGVSDRRRRAFERAGAEVWTLPREARGGIRLRPFLTRAGNAGILSLLMEGGGRLAGSFLRNRLVDRVRLFTAPVLLGGDSRSFTAGLFVNRIAGAPRLKNTRLRRLGDDWLVEGEF